MRLINTEKAHMNAEAIILSLRANCSSDGYVSYPQLAFQLEAALRQAVDALNKATGVGKEKHRTAWLKLGTSAVLVSYDECPHEGPFVTDVYINGDWCDAGVLDKDVLRRMGQDIAANLVSEAEESKRTEWQIWKDAA